MSRLLAQYDPGKVAISLGIVGGNQIPLSGWHEDDMITIEKNTEFSTVTVGVLGECTRNISRDFTGIATLRFQHTSPAVKYIENLKTIDAVLQVGGIGAAPIMTLKVVDPSSNDTVFAAQCFLYKDAVHSWGKEAGVREYQFYLVNMVTAANETLSIVQNLTNLTGLL